VLRAEELKLVLVEVAPLLLPEPVEPLEPELADLVPVVVDANAKRSVDCKVWQFEDAGKSI